MSYKLYIQLLSVLAIHIAAFFLVNPTNVVMPENVHMLTLVAVILIAMIFSAFVIAEGKGDERDNAHRALAGRVAFFVGALVMVIGITYQTFQSEIDPWLLLALSAMITGKVIARLIVAQTH